ncbi:hypothetical protein SAMN06295909_1381 [Plantibacter sp. VKM Ac-1784]|uniref:GIY-YIG domain-containing protein n=1 Tax=Plantibacter elymi (nom. nud.) TaxID=199708 RepID=A0ABY1RDD3_9MICO|nr:hypothetical protein [Plantibacter sp. VKM Ac-1784]SMQ66974.1 hypothetical protein SAMN06295909_1381 [Plantibacter sp. VKM Ac-1784]
MAQLMRLSQLRSIAEAGGITLLDHPIDTANLYALVDPNDDVLYIGKAASKRRHLEEESFAGLDYEYGNVIGFAALVTENDASRRPLRYDPDTFDPATVFTYIAAESWAGPAIDRVVARLKAGAFPSASEVEEILIRIHVRTGRLIGNSQFASQWETPIGSFEDTIAVLAAGAARMSGVLGRHTSFRTLHPRTTGVTEGEPLEAHSDAPWTVDAAAAE